MTLAIGAIRDTMARIAAKHGLSEDDLVGRSDAGHQPKYLHITRARDQAIWTVREFVRVPGNKPPSWTQIGRVFHRDHTSCISAHRRHQARIDGGEA